MAQELKAYNVVATADVNPDVVDSLGCTEWAGYDKDEVDAVLTEKDAEIRKLQRALYKVCANWAYCEKRINGRNAYEASGFPRAEEKFCKKIKLWGKMKDKCLAYADKFKEVK